MTPYITTEHNLEDGMHSSDLYWEQFKLSVLARAMESGAASSFLNFSKRAFGDAVSILNALSCYGVMHTQPPSNQTVALPTVLVRAKERVNADQPNCFYSLVEFAGARSNVINTSQANKAHRL
ncbi:hypothetical protein FGRMN_7260 [Fusarium graminum]|nr:hypothetical protein FGRMN_7260 [Fusarium graminum]